MATNRIRVFFSPCDVVPLNGWFAFYRPVGSGIPYRKSPYTFTSPLDFNDTLDALGTNYEGIIKGDCGNGQYSAGTGFVTSTTNVVIDSSAANISISSITGIAGFTFSPPLVSGGSQQGNQTGFTGSIVMTFNNTPVVPVKVVLFLNGIAVECINLVIPGSSYGFTSRTYLATDSIHISFETGTC